MAKKPGTKEGKESASPRNLKNTVAKKKTAANITLTPSREKLIMGGFPIVAIGASAGGLEAFECFFKAMPDKSGIAFILIAHLDPTHVSLLPELLQRGSKMEVHQVRDGVKVQANHVYVIPPNKDLTIINGALQLTALSQPRGSNMPIDNFFRSLAKDQGSNAICIILSGTGSDGTLGLKAIKGEIGMAMVQDEESAKYNGMPRSAIATGIVDYVLPPEEMPVQLLKYTKRAFGKFTPISPSVEGSSANALQNIYAILRRQTEHDFSLYKKNTICRRIERRMNVHQIDDIKTYASYLQTSDREVDILFKDLLIGVTNFFRDSAVFDNLRDEYLPKLLSKKPDDYTIRVWVAGCSSGEEVYSLAIILQECMQKMGRHFNVQIFGTDIDDEAINIARAGLYPESIKADVSPERLKRYFNKVDGSHYQIKKVIREMLVFAPQDVIKDAPFTKLDILSCRNLLIYLGPELQTKLLPLFHYCLKSDGILVLGSSETVGQSKDLFADIDKKWKIFRHKETHKNLRPLLDFPTGSGLPEKLEPEIPDSIRKAEEISALQLVESILQHSNTPPCAIIDEKSNVVYIHGRTGKFLEPAEGKVTVNILEMAREGLKSGLASGIRQVAHSKQEIVIKDMVVNTADRQLFLDITIKPVLENSIMFGLMMVVFEEIAKPSRVSKAKTKTSNGKFANVLEQELQYTKENLQTTIEELETTNEELKSTNEELQSTNEELQSTNEEMETSKEELQSLNEESNTVNAELQSRIAELSKTHDDMKNLLDSTDIATLFLDMDQSVRRFTPKATEIIPLLGSDIGRPIGHFSTTLVDVDLSHHGELVLKDLVTRELEAESHDNKYFIVRLRPFRTITNVIDGLVITFEDITARKKAMIELQKSEDAFRSYFDLGLIGMAVTSVDKSWVRVNNKLCEIIGYSEEELIKLTWSDITHPDDVKEDLIQFNRVLAGETEGYFLEKRFIRKDGQIITATTSVRCVRNKDGTVDNFFAFIQDITDRKETEKKIADSLQEKEILLKEIHHRVKNNLQVVSSLLSLQKRNEADPHTVRILMESERRVKVMAQLHETLHQSDNLSLLDSMDYISRVSSTTVNLFDAGETKIIHTCDIEKADFDISQLMALGQIVSELVSNCAKHAFAGREVGNIMVGLHRIKGEKFELSIKDDGIGFPDSFNIKELSSLGLKLTQGLVRQLHGTLSIDNSSGANIRIIFERKPL